MGFRPIAMQTKQSQTRAGNMRLEFIVEHVIEFIVKLIAFCYLRFLICIFDIAQILLVRFWPNARGRFQFIRRALDRRHVFDGQ
jgi:hypothetical protein